MQDNSEDEAKKKLLIKKVEKAAEEIRSKQLKEERSKYADGHLSIFKKREDPYAIVMKNQLNNRKKKIIVTVIIGILSMVMVIGFILNRKRE